MAERIFSVAEHIIDPFWIEAGKVGGVVLRLFGIAAPSQTKAPKAH
jgi:hypothetical protein